jgi:hypothetical protein
VARSLARRDRHPYSGQGSAPVGRGHLHCRLHVRSSRLPTTWPRAEGSGPCGAASLWACPQQAVPLRPSPPEGRPAVPALDRGRGNAVAGRCVEVPNFGWDLRSPGRARPRPPAGKGGRDVGGELDVGPTRRAAVCGHARVPGCARVPAGRPARCPPASAAEGAAPLAGARPRPRPWGVRRRCPLPARGAGRGRGGRWRAGVSPARSGEGSRRTTRKGGTPGRGVVWS